MFQSLKLTISLVYAKAESETHASGWSDIDITCG